MSNELTLKSEEVGFDEAVVSVVCGSVDVVTIMSAGSKRIFKHLKYVFNFFITLSLQCAQLFLQTFANNCFFALCSHCEKLQVFLVLLQVLLVVLKPTLIY